MFGKCVFIMSRALSLGISLNMLCMSKDTRHLVGGLVSVSSCFLVIYCLWLFLLVFH